MGRLSLIIPPSVFLLDERVFVSLGVLRVAAALEHAGVGVELLDLSGIENYLDAAEYHARATVSCVFGITITTPQLPAARRIIERIRSARPDARIILGGPHVTLVNSACKLERRRQRSGRGHAAFTALLQLGDVLVAGDGERAIFQAIDAPTGSLVDGDDPKGGLFLDNAGYNAMPLPARHLVDMASYHYSIDGHPAASLIAQLGCPFGCGFCGGRNSNTLRMIRTRTSESIVGEMELLYSSYGVTGFMFYDDELNVSKSLIELMDGVARLQQRLGVEFRCRGFVKSELFTDAQAQAMYRAGFRWILAGFESASPRILTNINKRATLADNTRCVEIARRHGLKVKALMSIGHPGESPDTIRATRDWLIAVRPDDFDCSIITTYPGTPYYDEAIEAETPGIYTYTAPHTGDKLHSVELDFSQVADYYKGDPDGGYQAFVFTDFMTSQELVDLRQDVEQDVRMKLSIPFNPSRSAQRYEHSMGMLPPFILRQSE